jgi:hypothetical protein
MGFFGSSDSHLDDIRKDCLAVSRKAQEARDRCDASLRGKHEMMDPAARASLLKQAKASLKDARKVLDSARQRETRMEEDRCTSEDMLTAHARVLEATLDVQRAEKAIKDGCDSIAQGVAEIEQFFGAGSPEAKQVRRVLADLQAG